MWGTHRLQPTVPKRLLDVMPRYAQHVDFVFVQREEFRRFGGQ